MTGYASHKGLPAPRFNVIASGVVLLLGGLGIVFGIFPTIASIALAAFLLAAAVLFHDFWSVPEEQQQSEMTNFLKNVALAGGAIAIGIFGLTSWEYSLGIGLF